MNKIIMYKVSLFQSFQNQTIGMTAILTSGEAPGHQYYGHHHYHLGHRDHHHGPHNHHGHQHNGLYDYRGVQGGVRNMCSDRGRLYDALLGQHLPAGGSETHTHSHTLTHTNTHSLSQT